MTNLDAGVVNRQLLARRIALKIVCWRSLFMESQSKTNTRRANEKLPAILINCPLAGELASGWPRLPLCPGKYSFRFVQ
jgi:hypothetical protein